MNTSTTTEVLMNGRADLTKKVAPVKLAQLIDFDALNRMRVDDVANAVAIPPADYMWIFATKTERKS